jgi:molybdate transport system substrate-binding protein
MRALWLMLCVAGLVGSLGCRGGAAEPKRELVVFAASSLRDAFTAISAEFVRQHPGAEVTFNFAGSQELRAQLEHGARADVFAAADREPLQALLKARRAEPPRIFAHNRPVIVVAERSATVLRDFADLARAERLVLGAPEVPIGRYTARVLDRAAGPLGPEWRARVASHVVSRELNVRQVLAKVSLGEADAGIVYQSDVRAAPAPVRTIEIPEAYNETAEYPLAVLTGAPNPELARAWVQLVLSDAGQRTLQRFGFLNRRVPRDP